MGNINTVTPDDVRLVKAGEAMVTAGGILTLGEAVVAIAALGASATIAFVAPADMQRPLNSMVTMGAALGTAATLGVGVRVFDVKLNNKDTDANLVRAGESMITAGGILTLGETMVAILALGSGAIVGLVAPAEMQRTLNGVINMGAAVGTLTTLAVSMRVFDIKNRGLV
jgi:hypothetical protein